MVSQKITQLKNLQQILIKQHGLEQKLVEFPKNIATKQELLARMKKAYHTNLELVEQKNQDMQNLRNELERNEREREDRDLKMNEIKTQREYEALEKEIREHAESENKIRSDQESISNELEQLTETINGEKELIQLQEEELSTEEESMGSEVARIKKELKKLEGEKKQVTQSFDEEFLFKFERIINTLGGEGIVALRSVVCSGCNMILPNHLVNRVRKEEQVFFCPHCSKVLYTETRDDDEQSSKQFADADAVEVFDSSMSSEFAFDDLFADTEFEDDDEDDAYPEVGSDDDDDDDKDVNGELDGSADIIVEDDSPAEFTDAAEFDGADALMDNDGMDSLGDEEEKEDEG